MAILDILAGRYTPRSPDYMEYYDRGRKRSARGALSNLAAQMYSGEMPMDKNALIGAAAQIDPMRALFDQKKYASDRKLELLRQGEGIREQFDRVIDEASEVFSQGGNVSPYLLQLGKLNSQYKSITGQELANKDDIRRLVRTASQERRQSLKEEQFDWRKKEDIQEDTYASVQKVVDSVTQRVDKDIRAIATGSPELKRAIALMTRGVSNPAAINSAMKVYVKSLDNSAVMQGEIAAIAGASWLEKVKGWFNSILTGNKMSALEQQQLWQALQIMATAQRNAVDEIKSGAQDEALSRLNLAIRTGKLPEDDYTDVINEIIDAKLKGYSSPKVADVSRPEGSATYMSEGEGVQMPEFQDVKFGNVTTKKSGGGKPNPFATVDF